MAQGGLDIVSTPVDLDGIFARQWDGANTVLGGVACVGVASMMGSVNYLTTIIQMRAPA